MSAPPTLVTVEVVDDCWLVYDEARGYWTLRHQDATGDGRRVPRGGFLTLLWPGVSR